MLTLHAVIKFFFLRIFFLSFSLFLLSLCAKFPIHTKNSCPPMCARWHQAYTTFAYLNKFWRFLFSCASQVFHSQKWCYTYIFFSPNKKKPTRKTRRQCLFVCLHSARSTITYVILHFKQILMRPRSSKATTAGGPLITWKERLVWGIGIV